MQQSIESRFRQCTLAAPDRILVATDLTDTEYLVPHAVAQAQASGARITLLHAILPLDAASLEPAAIPYIAKTKIMRDARVLLLRLARQFESQGIFCDTVVREGPASHVIREELRRSDAARLIMSTHGRGKLEQFTLGSVAHELIVTVEIPIFLVGPFARDTARHVTPRRILHPVSLMGGYRESVDLALKIAQTYRAELNLLHVLDRGLDESVNPARTLEWANHALEALIPDATDLMPPVHTRVTSGKLAEEVLKEADRTEADWIVLGADGGYRSWPFNENAAYKVLTEANCPVLTLRHEPYRAETRNMEEVHFTSPL